MVDGVGVLNHLAQKLVNLAGHVLQIVLGVSAVRALDRKLADALHDLQGVVHVAFAHGKAFGERLRVFLKLLYAAGKGLVADQVAGGYRVVAQFLDAPLASQLVVGLVKLVFLYSQPGLHVRVIHSRTDSSHVKTSK